MEEQYRFRPRKIVKQLFIAVLFSVSVFIILFSFFSWYEIPNDFSIRQPIYLLGAFSVLVITWLISALRIFFTCRVWNKKIRMHEAITAVLSGYFFGGITPANAGGSVAEIYILNQAGLTWGEAGSLTTICGILYQISLLLLFFLLFVGSSVSFLIRSHLFNLIYSFFLIYAVLIGILFLFIRKPHLILSLVEKIIDCIMKKFPSLEKRKAKILQWIEAFLSEFKEGFIIFFLKKPQYLVLNLGMHILYFLAYFSIAHFVILALGMTASHSEVIRIQIPVFFIFSMVPTPGASGGVELGFSSAFASLIGGGKTGIFVFYWRIITYYITLIIGGIIFFRSLEKRKPE